MGLSGVADSNFTAPTQPAPAQFDAAGNFPAHQFAACNVAQI